MRIRQLALCTALASSLAAQGSEPGFQWMGVRAGSLSFDPQENVRSAPSFGAQGGIVFDQQHYGISFEGLVVHPKSDFTAGKTLTHSEVSATLMTGLSSDPASRFWPYLGLGLGAISIPKVDPATLVLQTTKGTAAHVSVGFLHRAGLLIWGLEGRYLLSFTPKDLREIQGYALVGFSWGGPRATRQAEASSPPAPVVAPPPPTPLPVVDTTPAPSPRPVATVPPPAPLPVVETTPQPAPRPLVAVPPPPVPRPLAETVPVTPPKPVIVEVPPPPAPVVSAVPPIVVPVPATRPRPAVSSIGTGSTLTARLDALRLGDMPRALELGRKRIEAIPAHHWTIRLEIADLPSTLKNAVAAFPGTEPDLFIAPIKLRGGKTSYQLFLGDYPSKADAERAARSVPSFFLEGGQRPKPFSGTGLPQ